MSSIDYYEGNPRFWGNYQYVTLEEIVTNYLLARTTDDTTLTVPRHQVIYQAKRGIRELYYDVVQEIRAIELELSPSLTLTVPPDFVNYVRLSFVDENGHLHPIAVDKSMNIANSYLQDHNYELLYDSDGCVLEGSGVRESEINEPVSDLYNYMYYRFAPNSDTGKSYDNGRVRFNRSTGIFEFGVDVKGKNVVLEYISDGLYTGCEGRPEEELRIHKFAESAVNAFIYFELVKNMRNVPAVEKQRAKKEYFNNRRIAKRRINSIKYEDLIQTFKSQSKWIKGE